MKYGDIDSYINAYPALRKWVRECPICHAKGFDPKMPDRVGGGLNPEFAASYIKHNLIPLEVDDMGLCPVCSKHFNKK